MSAHIRTKHLLVTGLTVALTGAGLAATAVPAQSAPATTAMVGSAAAVGSSTALTVSKSTVGYGAPVTVVARVTTTSGAPEGQVTFVIDGASTKVPLREGVASLEIKQASVGVNTVSATFTPSDTTTYEGSSAAPSSFTVVKAATVTRVRIMGKLIGKGVSTTIEVVGLNATLATGKVRLVVRTVRDTGFRETRQGKLGSGSRGFNLGRLDPGRYKMVVKYVGDSSHSRSKSVKRFFDKR